ncbi:MAG: nitrogenase molybdenum-iron protein subunit beta [Desulfovibrio sp.]|nr:nitrogenase molybdenum-iron protein subunit beta [Desulfovibrio sp.]
MLDLTPKEISPRNALRINPCKTCQPVGALYAALGVRRCMPHSHGSQGCVSYHRSLLTRHFKEPAIAASSSFTEGASVFGGGANLRTAVKNIFDIYDPDVIAVHTTCLSETIGDDLSTIILDMQVPEGKVVVHANTPSYVGSHVTGYANMLAGFIRYLARGESSSGGAAAVLPGFLNPGDLRELKRLLKLVGLPFVMFPDQSGVMDAPMTNTYEMYPQGGAAIEDIRALGSCAKALALGFFACAEPADVLEKKCKVPNLVLPLPIGIMATDELVMAAAEAAGTQVPAELEEERGRLLDLMLDANPYFYDKKVAVYGDPDTVAGLTGFVLELGMRPAYVLTGTPGEAFTRGIDAQLERFGVKGCKVKAGADLFELHQWIKNEPVDLLLGTSYGKQISKAEDIPLVRAGFPILDRYGHSYMPIVGYRGGMLLAEKIAGALMDRQDRDAADEDLDVVM